MVVSFGFGPGFRYWESHRTEGDEQWKFADGHVYVLAYPAPGIHLACYNRETALIGQGAKGGELDAACRASFWPSVLIQRAGILVCATGTNMNHDVPISFEYHLKRQVSTELNWDIKMGHTSHSATAGSVEGSAAIRIFEVDLGIPGGEQRCK